MDVINGDHEKTPQRALPNAVWEKIYTDSGMANAPEVGAYVKLLEQLFPSGEVRLLEVGSGDGRMLAPLSKHLGDRFRCRGIDANEDSVGVCRRKYPDIDAEHADFFTYNNQVDVIVAPYTFFNMFNFETQQRLVHHALSVARVAVFDVLFAETLGRKRSFQKILGPQEFRASYQATCFVPTVKRTLKFWENGPKVIPYKLPHNWEGTFAVWER